MFRKALAMLAGLFAGKPTAKKLAEAPEKTRLEEAARRTPAGIPMRSSVPWVHSDPDSRAFGMSQTCRRMVRKSRLRRLGVAGSQI